MLMHMISNVYASSQAANAKGELYDLKNKQESFWLAFREFNDRKQDPKVICVLCGTCLSMKTSPSTCVRY